MPNWQREPSSVQGKYKWSEQNFPDAQHMSSNTFVIFD